MCEETKLYIIQTALYKIVIKLKNMKTRLLSASSNEVVILIIDTRVSTI